MLLLIDIGNTNITIGLYNKNKISSVMRIKTILGGRDTEEYIYVLKGFLRGRRKSRPAGSALCSVVPEITPLMVKALKTGFGIKPVSVGHRTRTGLKFLIREKGTLGEDRIANAVAAHRLYKEDIIVVDFGTATTFCVITKEGAYAGGAIMPGLGLSAQALAEKTAKLPLVELTPPESAIGKDTGENIRSGVILGHAGAVERIIGDIKKETGREYKVLATGGHAGILRRHIRAIDYVNPLLTLEGLRFIYEMNA